MPAKISPERVAEILALEPGKSTADACFARDRDGTYYRGLGDLYADGRVHEYSERVRRVHICGGCDVERRCEATIKGFNCGKTIGHGGRYKRINPVIYANGLAEIRGNPT